VPHRPAKLYEFDKNKYKKFEAEGFSFEVKEGKRKERRRLIEALIKS
jgi:8-oxo-dGTP diphosphatase